MRVDFTNGRAIMPLNPKLAYEVAIVEVFPRDENGTTPEPITTLFDLPPNAKEFASLPRMCGDWYAQIDLANGRAVCAIGPEKIDALTAVIAKARAVA